MKQQYVQTKNHRRFMDGILAVQNRGSAEACIMLLTGHPGTGKSTTTDHWGALAFATLIEGVTDIQRAARFYYLQKNAFGGKVSGQTFGTATTSAPRLNLLRLEEDLSQAHLRLSCTFIEHLDWSTCITKYDREHTLFYCDPPYWGTEGYGVDFGLEQYDRMAELAKSIKGKMIISVNDIPEMRLAFAGLTMESVPITYTVGGGGRASSKVAELIIRNW